MEKKCKLSIIIPMYNTEKYMARLLASCYQQDLDESLYEVIVIDDGSFQGGNAHILIWYIAIKIMQDKVWHVIMD